MKTRTLVAVAARLLVIATPPLLLATYLSDAEGAPKGAKPPAAKPPAKPKPQKPKADAGDAEPPKDKEAPVPQGPPTKDAGTAGASGELLKESEKKEGDAAVKVFEFGTTEIEGRARWPAVTYFVRRMRAEFEAQKLPHRPFMPELESTKGDPAVK
ncbi:MAG: hypothetical protein ACXWUG_03640 [Polyangiales bacterium]